jgi:hypothetical protein
MPLTQDAISSLNKLLKGQPTINNHQINKQRLLQEISSYVHVNASESEVVQQNLIYQINKLVHKNDVSLNRQKCENNYSNIVNSKLESGVINFSRDVNIINILIQLSLLNTINDKPVFIFKEKSQSLIEKDVETLLESSSFKGSISELESAQALSILCFFLLNVDISDKHKITSIISTIISKFPPDDWFSSTTVIYGLSFLLRSLIFLCSHSSDEQLIEYLKVVCGSMLKRMEIKREIMLCSEAYNKNMSFLLLEQLRFNIALFEISELFDDLRFLNAGMKANDRLYYSVSKMKISSKKTIDNINNISIALHYNKAINMQEKQFGSLICQI